MPSTNKRINLTLTDEIYERLQAYKAKNGIINDATACLQLVVQQLNAQDTVQALLEQLKCMTVEDFQTISDEGLRALKCAADIYPDKLPFRKS